MQIQKLMSRVNMRNIIPFLLSQNQFEEINDLKDYNESLGFSDQQARHINVFTSVLAIPVNSKQVSLFGQKVRLDAYDIDKYFCTYPSDQLQFLEISFSILKQKSYYEPEKYLHYIEIGQIRRFRKQAEINEYILFLNDKLTKLYQSPIQIPLLQNSTFYYRPPRPPTVMLQQELQQEEANLNQVNLDSISGYNSPKKSSPTHHSEAMIDYSHNFEEATQKNLESKMESVQNSNKQNRNPSLQHMNFAQIVQNQENQILYSSPRAQGGLLLDNISNLDSPTIKNQYNQRLLSNYQVPSSNNQLYFSPRSENRIYHGNSYSETNFQNSVREISMNDNLGRDEENLNQLLSQTQLNYQELFSPVSHGHLLQNQNFQYQESDEKTGQNTNSNNIKNFDSFTMTNSLLSPELRKPKGGQHLSNISNNHQNIEDSYNQFVNQINNQNVKQSPQITPELSGLQQRKLIKIQAAPTSNAQLNRVKVKRSTKKKYTNVNVEYDEEEEEEDDLKQDKEGKNNVISLKDIGSVDEGKKDQFAFNHNNSDDSDDLKKKQRDIIRDDSSVRSGESQFFSRKVNIFDIIINKREPSQMIYIRLTGLVSFLILIVLTFVLYLKLKNNLDVVWHNFNNLEIGPSIIEQYSQVLRNKEILFTGFFMDCSSILKGGKAITPIKLDYREALYNEGLKKYEQFLGNIDKVQRDLFSQSELQEYFFKNKTSLMILKWIVKSGQTDFIFHETTRGQALIIIPYYLNFYYMPTKKYLKLDMQGCPFLLQFSKDIYPQAFTYQNYQSYISSLFQISIISKEIANEKLQQTKELLIFSVVLVELISSLIVLVIFPVYYTIQGRKEEILKLICTFNSDFIQNQIARYKEAQHTRVLMQDDSEKLLAIRKSPSNAGGVSTNQIPNKFMSNQNDKKKRTLSKTNNLNRFSIKLSLRTLFVFLLLSLSPVLNLLLMRGFFENFKYNIEEHSFIYLTKSYLSLNYLTTYLLMNFPIYNFGEDNRNKLFNFISEVRIDNQNRLQTFYELDKNFQEERYNIDEYKSVFFKTLIEDGCQILLDNQNKSFKFHSLVQPANCSQVFQGKLKKGVILAIKEQFDRLVTMQDLYKNLYKNATIFQGAYYQHITTTNFQDLDNSYYYTRDIIDLLSQFIWSKSKDYFDYLIQIQLILFLESLAVLSLVFLVIGARFIKNLGSILYNTTFLFTLIPIDSLIENPYIFNYLNSENRRNKGK